MWGPFQISVEFAVGINVLPESQWSLGEKPLQMESTSQISKMSVSLKKILLGKIKPKMFSLAEVPPQWT